MRDQSSITNQAVSLHELNLSPEIKEKINDTQDTIIFYVNGDVLMDNSRVVGNITNSNFGSNANLQGDDVKQLNIEINNDLRKVLEELKGEINALENEEIKEDASMYYDMLIKYIDENKPSKIKRALSSLKDILSSSVSVLVIAAKFGIII